jgi:AraC-like DNA-binding protein
MNSAILPPPQILKEDVVCIRIAKYTGQEAATIKVCLNGLPGIIFQHHQGRSPVESITTASRCNLSIPTLYLYCQTTEPGVIHHKQGPYMITQVVLKPHALNSLFGLNATALTNNGVVELNQFSAGDLNDQLLEANNAQERVTLLTDFLVVKLKQAKPRDTLVEESLRLIHKTPGSITVKQLLEQLNISERHFERRFSQAVGISPQFYIRVKRFNEAVRLMKRGQFKKLTDLAHALNFYDQAHFIRDIKAFSGITPKSLSQKEGDFLYGQTGFFYV